MAKKKKKPQQPKKRRRKINWQKAVFVMIAIGLLMIILPIVVQLAQGLDADMTLVIGATLSASTFGSHACFYSDATVLTAQACGCSPFRHALTQIPYALLAAAVSALLYILIA